MVVLQIIKTKAEENEVIGDGRDKIIDIEEKKISGV